MDSVVKNPIKELLTPSPDGVTVTFYTSTTYRKGSVSVWRNGLKLIPGWDSGFIADGGITITMTEAPKTGDSVQAEYDSA